jgi:N-acetyl sugar amidotransferase
MRYCKKCVYPENAKPYIIFDDDGVCSGCRVVEEHTEVDWQERKKALREILEQYKSLAKKNKNPYDCLIPVSGGKDSHYQVHLCKEYGMNPLLVTYNHLFNTPLGIRNLHNLFSKFSFDHIRFSSSPEAIRKISRLMLKKCGDITWHYHCGILTYPIQMAIKYDIPLVIWAENNYGNLVGTFGPNDMVEFSRKSRKDYGLRGIEAEDLIGEEGIDWKHIVPFIYPNNKEIDALGLKGIYLSNFIQWNENKQAEMMIDLYDFQPAKFPRERTFNLYAKLEDCHANGAHDYLKYLKFGYGRATDDASTLIRANLISREEGVALVKKYDATRPKDLDLWLDFAGMPEEEFLECIDSLRDPSIWKKNADGTWEVSDSVASSSDVADGTSAPENNRELFKEGRYYVDDFNWLSEKDGYIFI